MQAGLDKSIIAFAKLGKLLEDYVQGNLKNESQKTFLNQKIENAREQNPWFDRDNILNSLCGLSYLLKEEKLTDWLAKYEGQLQERINSKNIAVIMAGNIPVVNFHDFLCVLISGNNFIGKLSSNDQILPVALVDLLIDIEPFFKNKIHFTEDRLKDFDAIIATGSNNSARYFEYYFGKYPHIIRKNRNSIAVLDGFENNDSLKALSNDIFRYYGMGCRNVSKLFVPQNYSFTSFYDSMTSWESIIYFHKYKNNYDYNKAIFLINDIKHFDNGFVLLKKDKALSSPLSVLNYQEYSSKNDIKNYISNNKDSIQCITASKSWEKDIVNFIPFGKSQFPELWDYADNIDTMKFLLNLA